MKQTKAERVTVRVFLAVPTLIDIFLIIAGVQMSSLRGAAAAQADMGYHYLVSIFGTIVFVVSVVGIALFLASGAKFKSFRVLYLLVIGLLPVAMSKIFF